MRGVAASDIPIALEHEQDWHWISAAAAMPRESHALMHAQYICDAKEDIISVTVSKTDRIILV